MSGPNDSYDPKEVAALSDDALASAECGRVAGIRQRPPISTRSPPRTPRISVRGLPIALARRELGALAAAGPRRRRASGQRGAAARSTAAYDARRSELERDRDERVLVEEAVDVTLPWDRAPQGGRHPLTLIQERVADVFVAMGWEIAEGPEVEAAWYNFDALNIPPAHPGPGDPGHALARSAGGRGVCCAPRPRRCRSAHCSRAARPATSWCPAGSIARRRSTRPTAPVFHQLEGLAVDEGLTMADLKGTLDALARAMFGPGMRTRLRPDHYPFTEPSADVDLQCWVCHGTSTEPGAEPCRTCRSEGWVEWGGSGMVHPAVLASAGVDPERYTGFAFGMGLERTLMSRHDMADIRDLVEGDVRVTAALGREELMRVADVMAARATSTCPMSPAA